MVVMTGASGGLGKYLCRRLAVDYPVIATYHTNELSLQGVEWQRVDVRDAASVRHFVRRIGKRLRRITLINLAGVSSSGMGHKMSEATWDYVVDTNLKGTFLMCGALLPIMREQGWGRIINVSSVVGQMGVPGTAAYSASKSGLFGLTRTLAVENALKGITVNTLALGYFDTGMISVLTPSQQEQIKANIPMQRLGHPKDVELAVRFLIEADYITGTTININGGLL